MPDAGGDHRSLGCSDRLCIHIWIHHDANRGAHGRHRHRAQHRPHCWGKSILVCSNTTVHLVAGTIVGHVDNGLQSYNTACASGGQDSHLVFPKERHVVKAESMSTETALPVDCQRVVVHASESVAHLSRCMWPAALGYYQVQLVVSVKCDCATDNFSTYESYLQCLQMSTHACMQDFATSSHRQSLTGVLSMALVAGQQTA